MPSVEEYDEDDMQVDAACQNDSSGAALVAARAAVTAAKSSPAAQRNSNRATKQTHTQPDGTCVDNERETERQPETETVRDRER